MALDDTSYKLLWDLSAATSTPPEYFLAILTSESGLRPDVKNFAGADYWGLNQIDGDYLKKLGIDPIDYLTWPASKQLAQVIVPYFKGVIGWWGKPPRSPGVLHGLQLCLPDTSKSDDPDYVLAPVVASPCGPSAYAANRGLDWNGDGKITFADLDASLCNRIIGKEPFNSALTKLYADPAAHGQPSIDCQAATSGGKKSIAWIFALAAAAGAGWYFRDDLRRLINPSGRRARSNPLTRRLRRNPTQRSPKRTYSIVHKHRVYFVYDTIEEGWCVESPGLRTRCGYKTKELATASIFYPPKTL